MNAEMPPMVTALASLILCVSKGEGMGGREEGEKDDEAAGREGYRF